ncbi:MAG: glycosyltransferase, partial [Nitrospirales bacterium]
MSLDLEGELADKAPPPMLVFMGNISHANGFRTGTHPPFAIIEAKLSERNMHGTAPSSPSNYRISIIVPTLNEAENVDALIGEIFGATSSLGQVEIIVVDDGSTDGTRQRLMALEADQNARGTVRLLPRDGERGLATAVLAGTEFA